MIDEAGLRANVGIILSNANRQVLWARRLNNPNAWQFPQGGMQKGESPLEAMQRELHEELGLSPTDIQVLAQTQQWYSYLLPEQYIRRNSHPLCVGQKQKWFLLRLVSDDAHIQLDKFAKPEFDQWCWVDYWQPLTEIVEFKREVYRLALQELVVAL